MKIRRKLTKLGRRLNPVDLTDYGGAYNQLVAGLLRAHDHDEAMKIAVGGIKGYERVGLKEREILIEAGLKPDHFLVNVGCGSGRLEQVLNDYLTGPLLGTDVVPSLLKHAEKACGRPDWTFKQVKSVTIPLDDNRADMVCFFSVLTHTLHEDSYRYFCEASRVLKTGGRIVISFLEFADPKLWPIFEESVEDRLKGDQKVHNQFISRDAIEVWASHAGLTVLKTCKSDEGQSLGQSVCVLEKT